MRTRIPSRVVEGLLFALTAFGPFAFGGVEPWSRAALEVLALLLALAVFLKGRPAASPAGSWFWLLPASVAAFGALQLATVVLPGGPTPLRPFTATPHETRAAVLLWAACAAVLYAVPRVVVTPDAARRYARWLFGVGVALAVLGLLQLATGGEMYWLRRAPKASVFGSYYNRDHAANILLMALALGGALFYARPHRLLAGGLAALGLGLLACASEASFIAAALTAAVMTFLGSGFAPSAAQRRLRMGAAIGGAALAVFFAYHHVVSAADAGAQIAPSVMARLSIYSDSLRWWRDAPLFGTGLGGFETIYPAYQDLTLLGTAAHAHSDWLEFLLETGVLGLAGALCGLGLTAFFAVRSWRAARSSEMRALIAGGLAAVVAFAGHSLFEFSFQIPANALVFFAVLGFLLSAPSWADKSGARPAERAPSPGAALLAAAYGLVLMRSAVLPAVAAARAGAPGKPLEKVVSLAQAVALDPDPGLAARLSVAAFKAPADATPPDYALMRISLRYALAASERRPFSADALYLTGELLRRLERPDDSRDYLSRSQAVRFSRLAPLRPVRKRRK